MTWKDKEKRREYMREYQRKKYAEDPKYREYIKKANRKNQRKTTAKKRVWVKTGEYEPMKNYPKIMIPRAWRFYESVLDSPKSSKQIAQSHGYSSQATFSKEVEGKPVPSWLFEKGLITFHGTKGKQILWKAVRNQELIDAVQKDIDILTELKNKINKAREL